MDLQLEKHSSGNRVSSFFQNSVVIGDVCYTTSLIVTPDHVVPDWPPQHVDQLGTDDLDVFLTLKPELILVGTGDGLRFPDSKILKEIFRARIGIEFMDSHAVCRTYNILAAEGRQVAAGIMIDQLASNDSLFSSGMTSPADNPKG
jgi:uncharacterized protein